MQNEKLLSMLEDWMLQGKLKDDDAIAMIFSNYINISGNMVGLTVQNAIKAGKLLRKYDKLRNKLL